jgi:hypothetical protein
MADHPSGEHCKRPNDLSTHNVPENVNIADGNLELSTGGVDSSSRQIELKQSE